MDVFWDSKEETPKPLTLFLHGYKGFKNWGAFDVMAECFAHVGLPFLKFNFSHNGTSPTQTNEFVDLEAFGNNTLSKELDDLATVLDAVDSKIFSGLENSIIPHEFNIIGFSRAGANAIIQAAKDSRIKTLVTWNSVSDFAWRWQDEHKMRDWKEKGVRFEKNARTEQDMPLYYSLVQDYMDNISSFDVLQQAEIVTQPWLLVHAVNDEAVPFEAAVDLNKANAKTVFFQVENSGHTFGAKHPYLDAQLPVAFQRVVDKTISFLTI